MSSTISLVDVESEDSSLNRQLSINIHTTLGITVCEGPQRDRIIHTDMNLRRSGPMMVDKFQAQRVKPWRLVIWVVLVDQSLEPRIFAQRVPRRIELEHWNGEPVRNNEQMIEKSKRFVEFPGPRINVSECRGYLWSIKCVLGFG